jgi:hypothetical protein
MISMDWLPTLLDAASTAPDADYPPDGMNPLPVLTGQHATGTAKAVLALQEQRTASHARRRLQVSEDPRQQLPLRRRGGPRKRGSLKHRHQNVFDRLVSEWAAWNAAMLPEIPDSFGEGFTRWNWRTTSAWVRLVGE